MKSGRVSGASAIPLVRGLGCAGSIGEPWRNGGEGSIVAADGKGIVPTQARIAAVEMRGIDRQTAYVANLVTQEHVMRSKMWKRIMWLVPYYR